MYFRNKPGDYPPVPNDDENAEIIKFYFRIVPLKVKNHKSCDGRHFKLQALGRKTTDWKWDWILSIEVLIIGPLYLKASGRKCELELIYHKERGIMIGGGRFPSYYDYLLYNWAPPDFNFDVLDS